MKKILIVNIILIILLNSFYVCFANTEESENILIKHKGDCPTYLKYKDVYKLAHYAVYENNGKEYPAYCLNPELNGVGSNGVEEYNVKINGKIENQNIWKVIINGYPYKTLEELNVKTEEEAYTATQFAIYTILHNRNVEDYTSNGTEEGKRTLEAYKKIVKDAKETTLSMSENVELISLDDDWKVDTLDSNYLSKTFYLKSNNPIKTYEINFNNDNECCLVTDENGEAKNIFLTNEKVKILIPIEKLTEEKNIIINVKSVIKTNPVLYGKTTISKTQNYAITGNVEEKFELNVEELVPKNISSIKVIKKEFEKEKRLSGVKFNLLDDSEKIVMEELITDENGEILLEGLLPGKYYLQEIETIEGYELNTEKTEINLEFNENVEVIVNNIAKEIIEEKEEVEEIEEIEVIPQKTLPVTGY